MVDTVKLPDQNPWNAPMFIGGLDFFEDGRAALSTFHGDVFIASGIDDEAGEGDVAALRQRALPRAGAEDREGRGLRDVPRRDLSAEGSERRRRGGFYEVFNNDIMVTKNFHEFVFDLHTDPMGNFYFAKAGPVKNGGRGFDEIVPHHGAMLRVSPDGKKLDVIATGFRAPNGIGVGPHGELTSGDNEGTWTPMCKINWVQAGRLLRRGGSRASRRRRRRITTARSAGCRSGWITPAARRCG